MTRVRGALIQESKRYALTGPGLIKVIGLVEGGPALPQSVERSLRAAGEVQLAEDVADVRAHRGLTDDQRLRNLLVALALGDDLQDLELPRGQRLRGRRTVRWTREFLLSLGTLSRPASAKDESVPSECLLDP